MTWTKLPDSFNDDPDLLSLPRGVRLMHVEALVWSNAHGTDGAIPRHVLSRITDEPDALEAAELLMAAGLWTVTDAGWAIAFEDQMPAAEVARRRAEAVTRTRRWDHHRRDLHDLCLPRWCKKADTSTDASIDDLSTRPVTTSPVQGERVSKKERVEAGDASAAVGGLAPAVAASPAERRWLPVTATDYEVEEWRDDFLRCDRCRGMYPVDLFLEDDDDSRVVCPYCLELVRRRRGKDCFAFTVPKKDAPSRPCHQRRPAGSLWCRYHERVDSRGQAPVDSRSLIDAAADKALAKLSSPEPEMAAALVTPEDDGDAVNVREAVRLWLKHRPGEPIPTTREDLKNWLFLVRHDLSPDQLAEEPA